MHFLFHFFAVKNGMYRFSFLFIDFHRKTFIHFVFMPKQSEKTTKSDRSIYHLTSLYSWYICVNALQMLMMLANGFSEKRFSRTLASLWASWSMCLSCRVMRCAASASHPLPTITDNSTSAISISFANTYFIIAMAPFLRKQLILVACARKCQTVNEKNCNKPFINIFFIFSWWAFFFCSFQHIINIFVFHFCALQTKQLIRKYFAWQASEAFIRLNNWCWMCVLRGFRCYHVIFRMKKTEERRQLSQRGRCKSLAKQHYYYTVLVVTKSSFAHSLSTRKSAILSQTKKKRHKSIINSFINLHAIFENCYSFFILLFLPKMKKRMHNIACELCYIRLFYKQFE